MGVARAWRVCIKGVVRRSRGSQEKSITYVAQVTWVPQSVAQSSTWERHPTFASPRTGDARSNP